jgi:hypothetical protein
VHAELIVQGLFAAAAHPRLPALEMLLARARVLELPCAPA